jgi:hypothetical protein
MSDASAQLQQARAKLAEQAKAKRLATVDVALKRQDDKKHRQRFATGLRRVLVAQSLEEAQAVARQFLRDES